MKRRILVVDDNHDSTDSLVMLLGLMGNEVGAAYDGEQALRLAETVQPEVVLLDLRMPWPDGYEVCRRIRARPWGRHVLLIAVTGWGQEADRRRSEEAGFDHHLVKPVDLAHLMRLLGSLPARQTPLMRREETMDEFAPAAIKPTISLSDVEKLDVRVGTIVAVDDVPKSDKLLRLTVDLGDHRRTVLAGMKGERADPQEIVGRQALFVVNLEPKRMAGQESQGMLFDIGFADGVLPALAVPERAVPNGVRAG